MTPSASKETPDHKEPDTIVRSGEYLALRVFRAFRPIYHRVMPFLAPTETKFLVALSILIGLVTGVGAYLFDVLIRWIFQAGFGATHGMTDGLSISTRWPIIILPAIGGLAVGPLIHFFSPESKGHGVPEVMRAMIQKGGRIRGRVAVMKAVCSALTIGTGGSAGREGPIVQIGSALGSRIAQILKMPPVVLKTMSASGAAAGIAAAFNAPLGGVAFSLEVIMGKITAQPFAMVVLAAVVAATVSRALHGSASYFQVPAYQMNHPAELGLYLVLGIMAGIVSKIYVKTLYSFEDAFDAWKKVPEYWRPAIGGLLVGTLGFFLPGVLGTGHHIIELTLRNQVPLMIVGLLIFGKIISTSLTLGSGGSGGVFMPSLFIGAMLGSTLGHTYQVFFPFVISPGPYALVGMAAVFAGATHAPLTAILIMFEMTYDYAIILPVMTATVASVLVSRVLEPETVYTLKLLRQGVTLKHEASNPVTEDTFVRDVMSKRTETLSTDFPLGNILRYFRKSKHSGFPVLDGDGKLAGMVTSEEVRAAFASEDPPPQGATVKNILRASFPRIHPDDTMSEAINAMTEQGLRHLPVVSREDPRKLVGILTHSDCLRLFGKRQAPGSGAKPPAS